MTRHLVFALALALVAAATALLLGDVGIFDGLSRWLFDRFRAESLWKVEPAPVWPWVPVVVAAGSALLVAWVAVDLTAWAAKLAVLAAVLGAVAFLSLTLAFYGVAFSPWAGLTAAVLGFAMGGLLAETPASRDRRDTQARLGGRAAPGTLNAWAHHDSPAPWKSPGLREGAVLAVRLLSPAPPADAVSQHLDQCSRALGEIQRLLLMRPGVILDLPTGDGARAFFGFRPDAAGGDLDAAAHAALELATFLNEEAGLQTQSGNPVLHWGLGLSVGPLLTGLHGPESHRFWTASGPAAEQARQLAALNARHHTRILIGRRAADGLAARFILRAVEGDAIHTLLEPKPIPAAEDTPIPILETEDRVDPAPSPPPPAP